MVVRITNRDVICQIAYAKIVGDVNLCAAYSHELPRYGLPVGLTNYAACYATGLLCARRLLKKLGLDSQYQGKVECDGELFTVEELEDGPRPFYALLDVGLARTTTGARIFAALRGALDGGLDVPHNEKRFRGYDPETKQYDVEEGKGYIMGEHVSEYMSEMAEEDPEKYAKIFSRYIKNGIDADNLTDKIAAVHSAIRANPDHVATKKNSAGKKDYSKRKMSLEQRKDRIKQKLASHAAKQAE